MSLSVQQLSANLNRSCYSNLTLLFQLWSHIFWSMQRLQCSWHDRYLCRGTEFNVKCGSSTMFAELPESPLPRDTVANANWTWLWHLWEPLQSLTFGRECRVEGRYGPCVDLLQRSTLATPNEFTRLAGEMGYLSVAFKATPYNHSKKNSWAFCYLMTEQGN